MTTQPLARIIFTSCCHHHRKEQPAWDLIAERKPDLLLLLGDNIYAEEEGWQVDDLAAKYAALMRNAPFRRAFDTIPTLATWDDHDLGPDNAMGDTPEARAPGATGLERRQEGRLQFLSHLGPSGVDRARLDQPDGEIYCSYVLNNVLIIVLDWRYYRQDIREHGADAQFLGVRQEAWLWQQLERAKSGDFLATLVCCGSTINASKVLGEDISHYRRFYAEFSRRFKTCPNPIFLSGDIHQNTYRRHDGFYEAIASGVAHTRERTPSEEFPDGLEKIDNFCELRLYKECAVFEFCVTDYGVFEERYPITGLSRS